MNALARCLLLTLAMAGAAGQCARAEPYPNRPVTLVVPFPPGGAIDILARQMAQKLAQRLGKPFVVDNRPGAGGVTAEIGLARAEPDGHTLMMTISAVMTINVTLYKKLPYDPVADFVPIAMPAATPFVLVVNPSLPVQSVADLVKLAKQEPGRLSLAVAGPGQHVLGELFKTMTGVEIAQVPYRGTPAALTDIVAGHVQGMFCDIPPAIGLITEGKLRALGVTTTRRVPAVPEIPPLSEAGVPGYDAQSWLMVVAPAGTPTDVVERLHGEIKSIMAQPDVTGAVAKLGIVPIDTPSVAELRQFVKSEIDRWGKLVHQAGIAGSQ
jgi:tripartite-type tricarboxylate transporter receptor subunit TctC